MAAPRADGFSLGQQRLPALRPGRRKRWQPRSLKRAVFGPLQAVTAGAGAGRPGAAQPSPYLASACGILAFWKGSFGYVIRITAFRSRGAISSRVCGRP